VGPGLAARLMAGAHGAPTPGGLEHLARIRPRYHSDLLVSGHPSISERRIAMLRYLARGWRDVIPQGSGAVQGGVNVTYR